MTEKDLYRYLKAREKEKRLTQELRALESVCYSTTGATMRPTPPDHSGNIGDKYSYDIEKLDRLRKALRAVELEINAYYLALERAEETLRTTEESELFDLLYRKGKDVKAAACIIGYSIGHTYRLRQSILNLVASVPA